MTENIASHSQVGGWDALFASVDELLRRRPLSHQLGEGDRAKLLERVERGTCVVPIYRIMLPTLRNDLFEQRLPEQYAVAPLPPAPPSRPITLYKIGESYFVRDGNRRVAAARTRGHMFLRANVVEYLFEPVPPAAEAMRFLLAQERADFFGACFFAADHPAHHTLYAACLGAFDELSAMIDRMRPELERMGAAGDQLLPFWYSHVYEPVVRVARRRHVLPAFDFATELDLFLWAMGRYGESLASLPLREQIRQGRRAIVALWLAVGTAQIRRS